MAQQEIVTVSPVVVSLSDLASGKSDSLLPEAFGPESLGIIVVKNLPAEFQELRSRVLSSASHLAGLPKEKLTQLEDPDSHFLNGWSLGKEILSNGIPDNFKGSFYTNCSFYGYPDGKIPDEFLNGYEKLTSYTAAGIWPAETDVPGFQQDLKALCKLMIGVAEDVARAVDRLFGGKLDGYPKGYLEHIVATSTTTKARLLHYFPPPANSEALDNDDSWCGEHFDFSCLTALTSAQFVDESDETNKSTLPGQVLKELAKSPDPTSGLYIKNRKGEVVKVNIPKDCLAFQTGSALQEATSGNFKAVPHYVQGSKTGTTVSRNTLAVFCQPSLHEPVGSKFEDFATYSQYILKSIH
ncbi:hypothetical protein DV454_001840 [Geotrichum candidum]|nr:hypothetical protein DV454_001840 [Geotrichum candidum]